MASVTHRVSTASTSNTTSYASGSFTPGASELLVVFVTASDTAAVDATLSDSQGLGFSLVATGLKNSSTDRVYAFVANALAAASAMTVTFDCSSDAATGAIIQVAGVSGMTLTGFKAIRQVAIAENQSAGTPTISFNLAALTGNPTLGLIGNSTNAAGMTAPTNWTEKDDTGYATPTTGAEYVSRDSGFTSTGITWGSSSASAYGGIIIELNAGTTANEYSMLGTYTDRSPSNTATNYNLINTPLQTWGTTETQFRSPLPMDGFIGDLYVKLATAPGATKSRSFTIFINGVATLVKCTVSGTNTTANDLTHKIQVKPGDLISIAARPSGTPSSTSGVYWGVSYRNITAGETAIVGGMNSTLTTVQRYNSLQGGSTWAANLPNFAAPMPTSGTFKNMYIALETATGAAKSRTLALNVNGSDSALTVTITNASSGSDTSHTVSVSAGDKVAFNHASTSGSPATTRMGWSCVFVPDTAGEFPVLSGTDSQPSTSATRYFMLQTNANGWDSAESDQEILIPITATAQKMRSYVTGAPGGSGQYNFTLRVEGSDTSLVTNITGAGTTGSDTTHTASITAGNLISLSSGPVASPGFTSENGHSFVLFTGTGNTTTQQTITGKSRVQASTSQTITGKGRVQKSVSQTITGTSRVQKSVAQTITGVSRVTATTTKTIQGAGNIRNTTTKTITGTSRIQKSSTQTIQGVSRVQKSVSQTVQGVANVRNTTNQTIAGTSRITNTGSQTIQGKSRIQKTVTQDIQGTANIRNTTNRTVTGVADIRKTASQDISGVSRIQKTVTKDITGVSNIRATATKAITGVSRLQKSVNQTITGTGRLQKTTSQTITGKANIVAASAPVSASGLTTNGSNTDASSYATASITPSADKLILAWVYSIASAAPNTPTASGNGLTWVQVATTSDNIGNRRITLFRAMGASPSSGAVTFDFGGQTQIGCAWSVVEYDNVDTSGSNGSGAIVQAVADGSGANATSFSITLSSFGSTLNATAGGFGIPLNTSGQPSVGSGFTSTGQRNQDNPNLAIASEFREDNDTSVDMSSGASSVPWAAIAVELKRSTDQKVQQTITGKANIRATATKIITGVSRITAAATKAIQGLARIQKSVTKTIQGLARITASALQTISGLSRIQKAVSATIAGLARIQKTASQTVTGTSRIQKTVQQTVQGKARVQRTVPQTVSGTSRITATEQQAVTGRASILAVGIQTITGKACIAVPPKPGKKGSVLDGRKAATPLDTRGAGQPLQGHAPSTPLDAGRGATVVDTRRRFTSLW